MTDTEKVLLLVIAGLAAWYWWTHRGRRREGTGPCPCTSSPPDISQGVCA